MTPRIRYLTLGRTGLEVSDIGFGSSSPHEPGPAGDRKVGGCP